MLVICTDPSVYPYREVRLTNSADVPLIRPLPSTQNVNIGFPRHDGGKNILLRPPQSQFEVTVRDFTYDQFLAVQELQGIQRRSRTRTGVYLFPNLDGHTRLLAPLCRSTKALIYDKATDTLQKGDPSTLTRAATAYFRDERGILTAAAANVPRFVPSVLGNGYMPSAGYQNLFTPYHPTAGNLMWTAVLGAPTIAWVTDELSPVPSKGGCVKITKATGSAAVVQASATIDNTTAGHHVWAGVALKGVGRVQLTLQVGANQLLSTTYTLTRRWTRYLVGPLPKTDASTTCLLLMNILDDGYNRTVFAGDISGWKQADTDRQVPQEWDDAAANAGDVLTYSVPLQTGELTFSCLGLMPPTQTYARHWRSLAAPSNLLVQFNSAGLVFSYCGGDLSVAIPANDWSNNAGRPYHLTARMQPGSVDLRIAILSATGTIGYYSGSAPGVNVQDFSAALTQNIGGNSTNRIGSATIQHVRFDTRRWSDAERDLHEKMYLQEAFREALALAQGRLFEIKSVELLPPHVTRQECDGRILLEQIDCDVDLAAIA